jgi:hypothetical protein
MSPGADNEGNSPGSVGIREDAAVYAFTETDTNDRRPRQPLSLFVR